MTLSLSLRVHISILTLRSGVKEKKKDSLLNIDIWKIKISLNSHDLVPSFYVVSKHHAVAHTQCHINECEFHITCFVESTIPLYVRVHVCVSVSVCVCLSVNRKFKLGTLLTVERLSAQPLCESTLTH